MTTVQDLTTKQLPNWCPACGDFNILFGLKNALAGLDIAPEKTVLVSGIGCGSKLPHFIKGIYGFEGLHGRSLPVATGIKLANKDLTVIITIGDGDCYGIGGNHLLHTMRRNLDITLIVENNAVYGLTKGQYSPTSRKGFKSPTSPRGAIEEPLNPVAMGINTGASFVARGYAYDVKHLQWLIEEAIKHKGFSIVDVLQPCSTYNKVLTIPWYNEVLYKLEEEGHDPSDQKAATRKSEEWGERVPIGLFFKADRSTYDEDAYAKINLEKPPVEQDINNIDITQALQKFR